MITANFWEDVRQDLLLELTEAGIPISPTDADDVHQVGFAYFTVLLKQIPPRPRTVHRSRELEGRSLPEDIAAGVALIEVVSSVGESLAPFLSERAVRPGSHDYQLSDWGIHHLHVRPQRGAELLFAIVEDDDFYFIDVRTHAALDAETELLEIVLANWPHLLGEPLPISGRPEPGPTSAVLNEARKSGVQPLVTLSNGKVYAPRGGGLTTLRTQGVPVQRAGSSARAVTLTLRVLRRARQLEKHFLDNAAAIAQQLGVQSLSLRYDRRRDVVIETVTGTTFDPNGAANG